jgi:AcrR family transcriptional regulator
MALKKDNNEETKNRIINVSEQLFSDKGFDATRVDEIAEKADVNKALIYYYFKSKEAILDYLMQTLFNAISTISMDFANNHVVPMIKHGHLDIQADRWHFTSDDALDSFLQNLNRYYDIVVDFALEHRKTMRIIMFESLKNSKHHNNLFRLLDILNKSDDNLVFKTIWEADQDYTYPDNTVIFKFFFGFIPLISFAAYFDDYKATSSLTERELRDFFLNSYRKMVSIQISGRDILVWP